MIKDLSINKDKQNTNKSKNNYSDWVLIIRKFFKLLKDRFKSNQGNCRAGL